MKMFAWSTDASSGARAAETAAPPRTAPRTALPDPAQLVWMEELREFLREPTMRLDNAAAVQALYIDYCSRWHGAPESDRWNPNTSINAIGVVVGDLMRARRPELEWRVIADCRPTTLLLTDAAGQPVASPLSDVATRWMAKEMLWMDAYLNQHAPTLTTEATWIPTKLAQRVETRNHAARF